MVLAESHVIYSGTPRTHSANCCFPSITRLPSGDLLASWRIGSDKDSADGAIMLARSADSGHMWSPPWRLPAGPDAPMPGEAHYGPLTALGPDHVLATIMWVDRSNQGRPFFHPETEGLLPVRTIFCESYDAGQTWRDYREMDLAPYHSPMPITGPTLKLADGRLACQFEVNKDYEDLRPWRHAAAWKISDDGGRNWPEHVEVANDPAGKLMYWDAGYALRANGFGLAAFWTYDRWSNRDATIHMSSTEDGGRHWSEPWNTDLRGQVARPLLLDDGRLLLVYVDRFHDCGIRAVVSNDFGRTFSGETVVYRHESDNGEAGSKSTSAEYNQAMNLWTFGRIDALTASDGAVLVVFYAGGSESTSIHCARLVIAPVTRPRHDSAEMHPWRFAIGKTAVQSREI
jgi:BNR repeat-like domain